MLITDHPEWDPAAPAGSRRRWRFLPAAATARQAPLPAGPAGFGPPPPDLVQVLLRADERHAGREALLGVVLAALMLLAVAEGWLWPVLACAFVAAPVVGIALETRDALRHWWCQRQLAGAARHAVAQRPGYNGRQNSCAG